VPTKSTLLATVRQPKIFTKAIGPAFQIEIYSARAWGYTRAYLATLRRKNGCYGRARSGTRHSH